jgi:hypothetical protein
MKKAIYVVLLIIGFVVLTLYSVIEFSNREHAVKAAEGQSDIPEIVVLQDLVESQDGEISKSIYEVYFVQVDKKYSQRVEALFKNFSPRIELGTNNASFTPNCLIDKVSQKPAKLFWAILETQSGGEATVDAGYYVGPEGSVDFEYRLKWNGTSWVIIAREDRTVS